MSFPIQADTYFPAQWQTAPAPPASSMRGGSLYSTRGRTWNTRTQLVTMNISRSLVSVTEGHMVSTNHHTSFAGSLIPPVLAVVSASTGGIFERAMIILIAVLIPLVVAHNQTIDKVTQDAQQTLLALLSIARRLRKYKLAALQPFWNAVRQSQGCSAR